MNRLRGFAALATATVLVLLATACLPDQKQLLKGPFPLTIGDSSNAGVAQTVKAGKSGALAEVKMILGCDGLNGILVEIRNVTGSGAPGSSVLASSIIFPGNSHNNPDWETISFLIPEYFSEGDRFAIVLYAQNGGEPKCSVLIGQQDVSYPFGTGFQRINGTWLNTGVDLVFETVVNVLAWP